MKTLLIVGFGDVVRRALPELSAHYHVVALVRTADAAGQAVRLGATPVVGDLDRPETLASIAGIAECVLHLAPPDARNDRDHRTRSLVDALSARTMLAHANGAIRRLERIVYVSTSGVYGDCGGARVDESRPVNPQSDRARRRVDAERVLLEWGEHESVCISVLRVPGIYAADRLPIERLERGTPALRAEDDVFTNHIHADDLAHTCVAALARGGAGRIYNVADESEMKMGEYFDLVADRAALPRPPRIARADAAGRIPPTTLSFMSESRRLVARRMKEELGVVLRYPTVREGVPQRIDRAAARAPKQG
ncbi:MAG: NAD-dependent epimerase/dehydratase family protein [Burkholderiales bacterium]